MCMKKGLRCVFRSPPKQGFHRFRLALELGLFVAYRTVRAGEPNENFTDYFQNSKRVSPKWFHL